MKKDLILILLILSFLTTTEFSFATEQNQIIAKINGEDIFQNDFNRILNAQKKKLIEKIVNERLLLQEAKIRNINITEDAITQKLNFIKEKQGGEEAFNKFLIENNATVEDARNEIKNQLLVQLVKNQINDLDNFLAMKKSNSDIIVYTNKIFPIETDMHIETAVKPATISPSEPIKMEEVISKELAEEIQKDDVEVGFKPTSAENKIFISDIKEDTVIAPINETVRLPVQPQKKWFKQKPEDEILVPGTPLATSPEENPSQNQEASILPPQPAPNLPDKMENSSKILKELRRKLEQRRVVNR